MPLTRSNAKTGRTRYKPYSQTEGNDSDDDVYSLPTTESQPSVGSLPEPPSEPPADDGVLVGLGELNIMPCYVDYDESPAVAMEYSVWYNVADLMVAIKSLLKVNFSIVESRQQALSTFNNLETAAPFACDRRFPEKGLYVTLGKGDWARKVQQLRTSLAFKEAQREARMEKAPSSDANDACLAYYNSLTAIQSQIAQREYVFGRRLFEASFGLTWN